MRACASGKAELATILYHWNSTALHLTNNAGKTCAQLAGESNCPSLREELEQLDRQKRKEALETVAAAKPRGFLKPRQPVNQEHIKERAASVDAPRTSSSPRKTTPSSSSTASSRHNRASSSSSSSAARSSKAELSKRRSVDSGINLESHNANLEIHSQPARTRQRGCRQLSK